MFSPFTSAEGLGVNFQKFRTDQLQQLLTLLIHSRGHGQDGQDGHDSQDGHDHLTGPFQGSDREDSYHQLAYVLVGYQ